MCETERLSLFISVHVGTIINTSAEYLCKNAERRQWASEELALTSAIEHSAKQANAVEQEGCRRTGTIEEDN